MRVAGWRITLEATGVSEDRATRSGQLIGKPQPPAAPGAPTALDYETADQASGEE